MPPSVVALPPKTDEGSCGRRVPWRGGSVGRCRRCWRGAGPVLVDAEKLLKASSYRWYFHTTRRGSSARLHLPHQGRGFKYCYAATLRTQAAKPHRHPQSNFPISASVQCAGRRASVFAAAQQKRRTFEVTGRRIFTARGLFVAGLPEKRLPARGAGCSSSISSGGSPAECSAVSITVTVQFTSSTSTVALDKWDDVSA